MLQHFLSPPNWFTSASIFCGFYAIMLAASNPGDPQVFYKAGLLIGFAGVFDMLDGRVARMTGKESAFGVQLDSLADAISFCIAPAVLAYSWGLDSLGGIGLGAAFFFALCGVFRLARFNVGADDKVEFATSKGLTTTMAGGTVAAMVMFHAAIGKTLVEHPVGPLVVMISLALLMVSEVPFRTLKAFRVKRRGMILGALFAGSLIAVGLVYDISFVVLPIMTLYAVAGPVEAAFRGMRDRRDRRRAAREAKAEEATVVNPAE